MRVGIVSIMRELGRNVPFREVLEYFRLGEHVQSLPEGEPSRFKTAKASAVIAFKNTAQTIEQLTGKVATTETILHVLAGDRVAGSRGEGQGRFRACDPSIAIDPSAAALATDLDPSLPGGLDLLTRCIGNRQTSLHLPRTMCEGASQATLNAAGCEMTLLMMSLASQLCGPDRLQDLQPLALATVRRMGSFLNPTRTEWDAIPADKRPTLVKYSHANTTEAPGTTATRMAQEGHYAETLFISTMQGGAFESARDVFEDRPSTGPVTALASRIMELVEGDTGGPAVPASGMGTGAAQEIGAGTGGKSGAARGREPLKAIAVVQLGRNDLKALQALLRGGGVIAISMEHGTSICIKHLEEAMKASKVDKSDRGGYYRLITELPGEQGPIHPETAHHEWWERHQQAARWVGEAAGQCDQLLLQGPSGEAGAQEGRRIGRWFEVAGHQDAALALMSAIGATDRTRTTLWGLDGWQVALGCPSEMHATLDALIQMGLTRLPTDPDSLSASLPFGTYDIRVLERLSTKARYLGMTSTATDKKNG